jgi:HAD superfamily hydrolase (TIGR01509 family)
MNHRALIFDFFGVLSVEVRSALIAAYARDAAAIREIHHAFDTADTGYSSQADLFARCAVATGRSSSDIEQFIHVAAVIDMQMVAAIRTLHQSYRTALCSNAPLGLVESLMAHYRFTDCFDEICISSALHILKPDPRIFTKVLERLSCAPADALFIDDNQHNTAAAEKIGITSIVHISREATLARLAEYGIYKPEGMKNPS